ncbi:MAG: tripartite tricarboxylate transporter substrate binding protein [Lachnospiraceae bacterium]|nr:tripartite tricarboxylate transporter substrate binding protein [Lachnospiraceae bacterium]
MKKQIMTVLPMFILCCMLLTACTAGSTGQAYPQKQITMIVPYGAGGTTDLIGRQFAAALEKELGQKIVVENMAGASGSVGARAALDAKADGYTLLFTADSLGTQRVMGISDMSYDDFEPVIAVGDDPKVMVVASGSPYTDADALLDAMRDNPGKIRMSYTGPGGSGHVNALVLNRYGLEPSLTAYDSGAEGLVAVLGGQVDFTNANYSTVAGYLASGDMRVLAVWGTERLSVCPDAPALSELIPESGSLMKMPFTPTSLVVAKDVPSDVCAVLREAAAAAVQDEAFDAFMAEHQIDRLYGRYRTAEEIRAFYKEWESVVSWMLYEAGATKHSPEEFGIAPPAP